MSNINTTKLSYKSVAWVFGTTSLRPAQLSLKIEKQLQLLRSLREREERNGVKWTWQGNDKLQEEFYLLSKEAEIVKGNATRKAKDARVLTSGLVDLGLINKNRELTEAGDKLLEIISNEEIRRDNLFFIGGDSFLYLKQLLKVSIKIRDNVVKPLIVLIKILADLDYLTYDEFRYLVPLITNDDDYKVILQKIVEIRKEKNKGEREQLFFLSIMEILSTKEEYIRAWNILEATREKDILDVIPIIALNRKSKKYSITYSQLYLYLKKLYWEKDLSNDNAFELYNLVSTTTGKAFSYWKKLLFAKQTTKFQVRKEGASSLRTEYNPFTKISSIEELKRSFFTHLHVFKTMATLDDYCDLNMRYIKLTDIVLFENQTVRFDAIPKIYFNQTTANKIYKEGAFSIHKRKREETTLKEIYPTLSKELEYKTISTIKEKFNLTSISDDAELTKHIQNERTNRFHKLIEERFSNDKLLKIIDLIEKRKDEEVYNQVTDDADIPTIFEYIIAIAWFRISECKGDILSYMKLSLDNALLPKSHAGGGTADIVYKYYQSDRRGYPDHTLLIEATLTEDTNQRRTEMEPVSRHLAEYILQNNTFTKVSENNKVDRKDQAAQAIFIATHLDTNTRDDFYARRFTQYSKKGVSAKLSGTNIIGINTKTLTKLIQENITYSNIYPLLQEYFSSKTESPDEPYQKFIHSIIDLIETKNIKDLS